MNRKHTLLASIFLLATAAAFAQDTRGKIQGRITDATDAVIVGAAVTLANNNTAIKVTTETPKKTASTCSTS